MGCAGSKPDMKLKNEDGLFVCKMPDGRTWEYSVSGPANGTPCLMLHGGCMTGQFYTYSGYAPVFNELKLKVIAPSWGGCGLSDMPPAGAKMDLFAKDCLAVLAAEGVTGKFYAASYSQGGPVICELMKTCSGRIISALFASPMVPLDAPGVPEPVAGYIQMMAGEGGPGLFEATKGIGMLDGTAQMPPMNEAAKKIQAEQPELFKIMDDNWKSRETKKNTLGRRPMIQAYVELKADTVAQSLSTTNVPSIVCNGEDEMGFIGMGDWLASKLPASKQIKNPPGYDHFHFLLPANLKTALKAMIANK